MSSYATWHVRVQAHQTGVVTFIPAEQYTTGPAPLRRKLTQKLRQGAHPQWLQNAKQMLKDRRILMSQAGERVLAAAHGVIVTGDTRGSGTYLHVTAKMAADDEVRTAQRELEAMSQDISPQAAPDQAQRPSPTRCDNAAQRGTGTGVCDTPLDEHGQCSRASDHIDL